MNSTNAKIEMALLDVRKAYRLLHDYQRLALDAVNYLGTQLGFELFGAWPKFSALTPRERKVDLGCWAWDWLNMMFYDFHFTKKLESGELRLSILLISDTGFFCSEDHSHPATEVAEFLSPEKSMTVVGFLLSKKVWRPEFMKDRKAMKTFIETGGQLPAGYSEDGLFGKCCPFARLESEEKASALLDELVFESNKFGIPLARLEHNNRTAFNEPAQRNQL